MKLVHPDIQQIIQLQDGTVSSLVIENPSLMFRFLSDVQHQLNGEEGDAVLSIDEVPVSMKRWVDLLIDFVGFDGNEKTLITKIIQAIKRTAQSEQHLLETHCMLANLESYLNVLAYEQDLELKYEKLSLVNLLKAVGIQVVMDYNNLAERLLSYMNLITRFDNEKLFLFVNLRSFVSDDEMELFLETIVTHGWKVLLLDNHATTLLPQEKRILIDRDLCEI